MQSKIFIVVLVTYDWHRFQENLYASTDYKDCLKWIDNYKLKLPIIEEEEDSFDMRDFEIRHLWIQKF